jgi:hypothetical protein
MYEEDPVVALFRSSCKDELQDPELQEKLAIIKEHFFHRRYVLSPSTTNYLSDMTIFTMIHNITISLNSLFY